MAKKDTKAAEGDEAVAVAPAEQEETPTVAPVETIPQEKSVPKAPAIKPAASVAAPEASGPRDYVVTLTDRVRPHKLEASLVIAGHIYPFRRPMEAAKGRPAVSAVLSQTIRLSNAQARQLSREGWDLAPAEK